MQKKWLGKLIWNFQIEVDGVEEYAEDTMDVIVDQVVKKSVPTTAWHMDCALVRELIA